MCCRIGLTLSVTGREGAVQQGVHFEASPQHIDFSECNALSVDPDMGRE